ncbi:hypothetical protein SLS60_003563 [Paraconiothyrium brasiliense]|uniref:Uncharacterized protein n=1 Tax=Paraconiothyrium brasiliense TaxID=300254 RepID=A0ABR3RQJ0_9PLEO
MVTLRAPSSLPTTEPSPSIAPPTLQWLSGPWNVTHSTLPMWKKNKNVVITYTPITSASPPRIDDLVTYQPISSSSTKTVHGVDKPFSVPNTADSGEEEKASLAYNWRGKGWLMIASSKWEILAHGEEEGTGNAYVVTFFAKTLFTPAGVDVYSRKGILKAETVEAIKAGLAGLGGQVANLAKELFEVAMDEERK